MKRTSSRLSPFILVLASLVEIAGCGDEKDTRPPKWSYISTAIVQPNCATANCHSDLSQRSGLKLSELKDGYVQLLSRHFVLPTRPTESALIGLMKGDGTRRMPPDFAMPQDDIDLISTWIANGALYDGPSPAPVLPVGTGI